VQHDDECMSDNSAKRLKQSDTVDPDGEDDRLNELVISLLNKFNKGEYPSERVRVRLTAQPVPQGAELEV
jgi:hypothetical protein